MITIRYVTNEDKRFWFELDKHLPEAEFEKKVRDRQGYVLFEDNEPVGILRYNLFWDNTPFCTMLYIRNDKQGCGYGLSLMKHWEDDMKSMGYGMLLTSTREDEEAQYFYRKLGYEDCGNLDIFYPGFEQPTELFLSKKL
jgi:ribosomal protein S18 acetylase RimI-like enzyme